MDTRRCGRRAAGTPRLFRGRGEAGQLAAAVTITLLMLIPSVRAETPETGAERTIEPDKTLPDDEGGFGGDLLGASDSEPADALAENTFADLDIEQLMRIQVTSVAGVEQDWFTTPAALYVITAEDIRRSGHRSIAEALRLAPGVNVGRINASTWAISARGFNDRFANKLQVVMDGRVLYDPLFSGVYWDVQDTLLADLDRIEVVRGPGATLWGANAVNGVINITTRSARETQGWYLSGGAGTENQGFGAVRYGGQIDDHTWFRIWSKYHNHDTTVNADGDDRHDDWDMWRGGLRLDHEGPDGVSLTVQSDLYQSGRIGESIRHASPTGHFATATEVNDGWANGGYVLGRLGQEATDGEAGWTLQSYYDRRNRVSADGFKSERDIFDIDFRHHFHLGDRHEAIWGLNYNHTRDDTRPSDNGTLSFDPASRSLDTVTAFVQDTITLAPETLFAMVGSKFEHNDFTGFEVQPSARLWWTPDDRQTLWAAVSRPVRTPSRSDDDLRLVLAFADPGLLAGGPPAGFVVPFTLRGDNDVESEELIAYEAGYRVRPADHLTLDLAAFYNDYRKLVTVNSSLMFDNDGSADAYGFEAAADWRITEQWRLNAAYSFLRVDDDGAVVVGEGTAPRNQFRLTSALDITENLEFNAALYYVDTVPAHDVPAYIRLDAGLTWRPTENFELSVWGQNLLDPQHPEFRDPTFQDERAEIERAVYFQATYRF